MEANFRGNKVLPRCKKKKEDGGISIFIKHENGKLIGEESKISGIWKNYFDNRRMIDYWAKSRDWEKLSSILTKVKKPTEEEFHQIVQSMKNY
ncbi:hypothetical protein HHI36_000299 [Cryptolaemus montrouzieri]|uniref:Uncharacterized protein n=1 Tax=Cryptolaemus montrouzieri TaxID=559131 RepID=A0ABD2P499_9CUCU